MKTNKFKLFGIVTLIAIIGFTFATCNKKEGGSENGGNVKANTESVSKVQEDPESDFEARPIDGGKSVEITDYVGDKWEVVIPSKIRDLPVTSIAFTDEGNIKGAFKDKKLIKVTIPNSVIIIGSDAFANNQLTSVTIPDNVVLVRFSAFASNQLTSVTIPDNVVFIEPRAFMKNQLTSVIIPDSVIYIGYEAFMNNKLTSVTISNSVTEIEANTFYGNQLTSITIGANVMLSEYYSFDNGFEAVYNRGKAAGTYTRPDANSRTWTKQ